MVGPPVVVLLNIVKDLLSRRDLLTPVLEAIASVSRSLSRERELCNELNINNGYFAGKEKQLELLQEILGFMEKAESTKSTLETSQLLDKLSKAYSLCPASTGLRTAIHELLYLISNDAMTALQERLKGRVILHISCRSRLEQARLSVESFRPFNEDESHVIIIGCRNHVDDMCLSFDGDVLRLPTNDDYEGLARKVIFSAFIANVVCPNSVIAKFDDDVRMTSRKDFDALFARVESHREAYLGIPVRVEGHRSFWHGWHLGKCSDPKHETHGIMLPLPKVFANGGGGYFLKPKALDALAYAFLTQQFYINTPSGWAEDAIVGFILENQNIRLGMIGDYRPHCTGYRSQESDRMIEEGDSYAIFYERLSLPMEK